MASPVLFFREFAGAMEDNCRLSLDGNVEGRGRDVILGKDLKYVNMHFWVEDFLLNLFLN